MRNLILSLRPKQGVKNLLIFAAILFDRKIFVIPLLLKTTMAFFLFSFLSGSLYIINDIIDLEKDRQHPQKSKRPIAKGVLKPSVALGFALILIILSLLLSFKLNLEFFLICLIYIILSLFYSLLFKNIIIMDIIFISLGFILRALAGIVIISAFISPWILVCTGLLALFLALAKRRQEIIFLGEGASNFRANLKLYSVELIDQMIAVVTSSTLIAYSLYTFSSHTAERTHNLMITIPFVVYGIFRYLYLIHQENAQAEPENVLFKDRPLIISILLWILSCAILLYLF